MKTQKRAISDRTPVKVPVDPLFRNVTRTLIRDFQANLMDPCFSDDILLALNTRDVKAIREVKNQPFKFDESPAVFKARYQIAAIDKRYRYSKDIYTDQELEELAIGKFQKVQSRLQGLDWDLIMHDASIVKTLSLARRFIHRILGDFDPVELRERARFGTGASVGVKAADAHLAQRFCPPITGTSEQITWWREEYDLCPHFQEWMRELGFDTVAKQDLAYQGISSLKLTFVPKSHKSLRAILANTTIGSYISGGIGEMIRTRLKEHGGLDIRRLQHQHRKMAEWESVLQQHCTVDLSSASDTISRTLAEILLPADWFSACLLGCMHQVELPDHSTVEVETFSTMGIGFTFTLQTLMFYSLVWAVRSRMELLPFPKDLRRLKTVISVYGDDLIFGSKLFPEVTRVLNTLGMEVNEEKSFVDVPFRESCGGDYFRGWDVRPFQPEVGSTLMLEIEYEALIYKFINGLRAKWTCDYVIWGTLRYLVAEIERHGLLIKVVPFNYPEDSGIRITGSFRGTVVIPEFLTGSRFAKPTSVGHGLYRFQFLKKYSKRKEEKRHGPYYWSAIRGNSLVSSNEFNKECYNDWVAQPVPLTERKFVRKNGFLYVVVEVEKPVTSLLITEHVSPEGRLDNATPSGGDGSDSLPPVKWNWETRPQADYVAIPHTAKYRRQKGISEFRDFSVTHTFQRGEIPD